MSEATFSVAVAEVESAREARARSLKIAIVMENRFGTDGCKTEVSTHKFPRGSTGSAGLGE